MIDINPLIQRSDQVIYDVRSLSQSSVMRGARINEARQ